MSADNGIFIFQTPEGKFAVVESTMSEMPMAIPDMIKKGKASNGDTVFIFDDIDKATALAISSARAMYNAHEILEYGVVNWSDDTYQKLMAPYL